MLYEKEPKGKEDFVSCWALNLYIDYQNQNNELKFHYSEKLLFAKTMPSRVNLKKENTSLTLSFSFSIQLLTRENKRIKC